MARKFYDHQFKKKARGMRKGGISYGDIAKNLKISKSTVKLWCQEIVLDGAAQKRLYTKQIFLMTAGPNSSKERRKREIDDIINTAKKEIKDHISEETLKLLGAMLYWAEGSKTQHFGVTNSDPILIKFIVKWIELAFGVKPRQLKAHLNIYEQQDELSLKKFWSGLTGIPISNFGKSFIKPRGSGFRKNILYYGTIRVRMINGSDSRHRVLGWIRALLEKFNISGTIADIGWVGSSK